MEIKNIIKQLCKWLKATGLIILSSCLLLSIFFYNEDNNSFNTVSNFVDAMQYNKIWTLSAYLADFTLQFFSYASFGIILLLLAIAIQIIRNKFKRYNIYYKIIMFLFFIIALCAFLSYCFQGIDYWGNKTFGGYVGFYLINIIFYLPSLVQIVFISLFLLLSLTILLDLSFKFWLIYFCKIKRAFLMILMLVFSFFGKKLRLLFLKKKNKNDPYLDLYKELLEKQNGKITNLEKFIQETIKKEKDERTRNSNLQEKIQDEFKTNPAKQNNKTIDLDEINNDYELSTIEVPKEIKKSNENLTTKKFIQNPKLKYILPSIKLLIHEKTQEIIITREDLLDQANSLKKVLADFKITGKVVSVKAGPIITLYEFEPSAGTKSSRIIGLADDIARNLRVRSARISVIENKNAMGIEIPNKVRDTIYLKEILESQEFQKTKYTLPLILGTNISGEPVVIDLAKAPHLLIAGTTGSGKSVSINTMILSLLYKFTPEECKFIMIDPKMLELSVYEGIPHLLSPVVTEPQKAIMSLKWVVNEMEERYRIMSSLGVRHISGYNEKLKKAQEEGKPLIIKVLVGYDEYGEPMYDSREIETKAMPYIVVVVDEMADLMITAGKDIEALIQRIAQMARAAGIHIIMATQRPSVDVITGVIKANFPSRISFLVSSKIDSKVIIGEQGAEQLLGMGDLLYMPNGSKLSRAHGPFVSDQEVETIVSFIIAQGFKPSYVKEIIENADENGENVNDDFNINIDTRGDDFESLYKQAVQIVKRDRKTSISYIQRMLRIGYNKAADIIDKMEKDGILGAPNSMGKREIID